jgi:NAD+ diphosphatase
VEFVSLLIPPRERPGGPAWWFVVQENKILIRNESGVTTIPKFEDIGSLGLPILRQHYLGLLNGHDCYAVEVGNDASPSGEMRFEGLRQIYALTDEGFFYLAGRAVQIIDWDRTHQFCGRCGSKTRTHPTERAKECLQCGLLHFPRLAPAIIVLVRRGREVLLARARRFDTPMYSVIAGFVEPGETLEQAVVREVREETGIMVMDIRYFGSQPWPFPHSLMVGFTANYASGEIKVNDSENLDVKWFTADNLPPIPDKVSIARKLIDCFLEQQTK